MAVQDRPPFLEALRERVLVFDGAMGTSLQTENPGIDDFGGARLEGWMDGLAIHAPQIVERVHRSFLDAGCDVIETCTFQATRPRLEEWGQGDVTTELNASAARLARKVADEYAADGRPRFVAGSMGPTGFLPASSDPAMSRLGFADLVPVYRAYNNGYARNDSNHRYATNLSLLEVLRPQGWTIEGVVLCAAN